MLLLGHLCIFFSEMSVQRKPFFKRWYMSTNRTLLPGKPLHVSGALLFSLVPWFLWLPLRERPLITWPWWLGGLLVPGSHWTQQSESSRPSAPPTVTEACLHVLGFSLRAGFRFGSPVEACWGALGDHRLGSGASVPSLCSMWPAGVPQKGAYTLIWSLSYCDCHPGFWSPSFSSGSSSLALLCLATWI